MVVNATLNGVTSFSLFGDTFVWGGNFLQYVSVSGPDLPTSDTANLTLTGSNWTVRVLELNGTGLTATVADDLASFGNRINLLRLSDGPNDVTLTNTRVRYIEAQSDSASRITLGNQETRAIDMQNGNTTIIGGTGFIGSIRTGDGNDTVTLQSGADQINLGSGNNTVTTGASYVGAITMYSDTPDVNSITVGTGGVRSIGLSNGRDTVTLLAGARVEQIHLGANNDSLTLRGDANVDSAVVGDGINTVSVGAGNINSLTGYGGRDVVTITTGTIQTLAMGAGNNQLTVGSGSVRTVLAYEGNDGVNLGGGAEINTADLSDGNNTVTLANNARINMLIASDGNDTVTLNGNARILMLKLDGGNNLVTTANGNIESYYSFGGNNTLNIGSGGLQQAVLSGDGGVHQITATGFVGSLQVQDNGTTTANIMGGAINISLAEGNDILTTGGGYIAHISTWDGNDTVNMGLGGAATIRLGRGDDLIRMNDVSNAGGIVVWGGDGVDTADFSQLTLGVDLSLSAAMGAFQTVQGGVLALDFFENLTGTALADRLVGSVDANTLTGALGNDTLSGLGGSDRLIGGRGNDSLTGGADVDTFQFSPGGGRDRIADFVAGVDLIEFTAATSLASITFAKFGAGVLLTVGTAEVVVENTTVAVMNDAANFMF